MSYSCTLMHTRNSFEFVLQFRLWDCWLGWLKPAQKQGRSFSTKKLKIGWLIHNVDDYPLAKRCFKCSRFNHRHQDCRGGETCPLCAGSHKLKECKAPADQYKCINCMTYNRYSKADKICDNHSSLHMNCPSMQAVLVKYKLNTYY
jgi:hypothetical protein